MYKTLGTGILLSLWSLGELLGQARVAKDSSALSFAEKAITLAEDVIDMMTIEKGRSSLSLYPMAGYSLRTGFEFGFMPVWRIKPKADADSKFYRPTTFAPSFQVSTKGMYEAQIDALVYTQNRWMFISEFQYLNLPDEYYGIGNQAKTRPFTQYDINRFTFKSDVLKGLNDSWFAGLRLDLNYDSFSNIKGDLLNPLVAGYEGGWANGVGLVTAYDNRDDQLYPSKGWFVMLSASAFGSFTGSNYKFNTSCLDVRRFISLNSDKSILGFQVVVNSTSGDVPFYKLASIGGKSMLRGIAHPYRYLEKQSWFTQVEWRKHILWRLGGVVFAGVGKVSPGFLQTPLSNLHYVSGAGLRFNVLPDEGLNFRIDFGISNHGDNGVYFTIREAF